MVLENLRPYWLIFRAFSFVPFRWVRVLMAASKWGGGLTKTDEEWFLGLTSDQVGGSRSICLNGWPL